MLNPVIPNAIGPVATGFDRYQGTVKNTANGPIPGVCVYTGPATGCPPEGYSQTDQGGFFAVDLPTGSTWAFNFEVSGYQKIAGQPALNGRVDVVLLGTGQVIATPVPSAPSIAAPSLAPVQTPAPIRSVALVATAPTTVTIGASVDIAVCPVDAQGVWVRDEPTVVTIVHTTGSALTFVSQLTLTTPDRCAHFYYTATKTGTDTFRLSAPNLAGTDVSITVK